MLTGRLAMVSLGFIAVVLGHGCIFGGCDKNGPPPPDECDGNTGGDVATLQLGAGAVDDGLPFVPWSDGDVVTPITGGQGLDMVALRLRVTGISPPKCLPQVTVVTNEDGFQLSTDSHSLKTYVDGDGRATLTLWIPTNFPSATEPVIITTTAGGVTTKRRLFSELAPIVDMSVYVDLSHDFAQPHDLATTD